MKKSVAVVLLGALFGCSGANTVQVSTKSVLPDPKEMFQAKNALAEQTSDPQSAIFRDVTAYHLSSGDRVYCGEMNVQNGFGTYEGYTPFYMRRSASQIKSVHHTASSADFASRKCAEAKSGSLNVAPT